MKKKLFSLLLCFLALGLNGCDEDVERASYLTGEWTGDMGMYFSDGRYDYRADYTDIRFLSDGVLSTHGDGEQIDFFDRPCPIRYQSFYFRWRVRDGRIYLEYPYDSQLNTVIVDYGMQNGHFYGYIENEHFSLVKLVDYDDWYLYDDDYYGYGYYDSYYAKGRGERSSAQRTDTAAFHSFRRMNP